MKGKFQGFKLDFFTINPLSGKHLDMFIGRERMVEDMLGMLLEKESFGITGAPGTGKSTLINILIKKLTEDKKLKKKFKIIRINHCTPNKVDFLKRILFQILEELNKSDLKKIEIDSIRDNYLYSSGIEEFLKSLLRYEPSKELDSYQVIRLYSDFLKHELQENQTDSSKVKFLSPEKILSVIVNILTHLKRHIIFFIDDMDKVEFDPLSNSTGEDRLATLLFDLRELFELSESSWIFSLPVNFYERYRINFKQPNSGSFLSLFSEIFFLNNFSRKRTVDLLRTRLTKTNFDGKIIDIIDTYALNLLLDLSRGNPRLFLYFFRKAFKFLISQIEDSDKDKDGKELEKRIKVNNILGSIDYVFNLDEKNKRILAYIAYKQKVDADDHRLKEKTGLDRLSLNRRLKELAEEGILDYFLDQYGKRIYITKKLT